MMNTNVIIDYTKILKKEVEWIGGCFLVNKNFMDKNREVRLWQCQYA